MDPSSGLRSVLGLLVAAALLVLASATALAATGAPSNPGLPSTPGQTEALAAPADLSGLNTADIDQYLREAQAESGGYAPEVSVRSVLASLTSGKGFHWGDLLRGLGRYLFAEIIANTRLLGKLVALAVLAAVLYNVQGAFGGGAGKVAAMVCYLAAAGLALSSFAMAFGVARRVVDDLVSFMQALLPTLMALLAANGGLVTVPLLHPVMVATINIASVLVRDVVLPLILVAAVLDLISGFSSSYRLGGVISLLRYGSVTAISLAMIMVLGVSSMLKASGPVADGVALRAGKFAASTFVPVVGKMFSDAAELVWGSSHVLLSAVGMAGAVGISLIVAFPLLKLIAIILTYRLAGALIQPVSDPEIVGLLNGVANSVAFVFVAVATVALLFFLGVSILMGASNALLSLRQL